MNLPHSYFEDEIRDGFYISGQMKRAWGASLEVLEVIAEICRRYRIPWFLDAGSLMGAVRHKGFIPWDDDLDICMKRKDYNRFLEAAQSELPEHFRLINLHTEPEFDELFSRVVNQTAICFEPEHLKRFHGFPYVVGVDIFPLDYVSANPEEEQFRCEIMEVMRTFQASIGKETTPEMIEPQLIQIEQMLGIHIDRSGNIKNQINLWVEKLCCLYSEQEAKELVLMPAWIKYRSNKFKKEYYDQSVTMEFEGMDCPVPVMYDAVLKEKYGDYMKPVRVWDTHGYPFYEEQEQIAKERVNFEYPKYRCSQEEAFANRRRMVTKDQAKEIKKIVIFPYKAAAWNTIADIWRTLKEDGRYEVCVVPLPQYEKDWDGTIIGMHWDGEEYPKEVEITPYDTFDLQSYQADVIITQNPYDQYNSAITYSPEYFTENLRKMAGQLIYIPYFVLDDFGPEDGRGMRSLESFCNMPGMVYADLVVLQSRQMKAVYVESLTEMAGEKTREIWEEKIQISSASTKENQRKSEKRKVLYYVSLSALVEHKELMLEKIRRVLAVFQENQDEIILCWKTEKQIEELLPQLIPDLWEKYHQIVEVYQQEQWGEYVTIEEEETLVEECDAYYGDASALVYQFLQKKKPVMLEQAEK